MEYVAVDKPIQWNNRPLCSKYLFVIFESSAIQVHQDGLLSDQTLCWAIGVLADGNWEVLKVWPRLMPFGANWRQLFHDLTSCGVQSIAFVIRSEAEAEAVQLAAREAFPTSRLLPSIARLTNHDNPRMSPRDRASMDNVLRLISSSCSEQAAHKAIDAFALSTCGSAHPEAVERGRAIIQQVRSIYALPSHCRCLLLASEDSMRRLQRRVSHSVGRHGTFANTAGATMFVLDALRRAEYRLVDAVADVAFTHLSCATTSLGS